MSTRTQQLGRTVDIEQYLDANGLLYLWDKTKAYVDEHAPAGGNDLNLAPGCLLTAHNWQVAPTVGETQTISASYLVGRYPAKNSQILALIRLVSTGRPIYVAYYEVVEVPENPTVNSTYTMQCLNLYKINDISWDDITGKPTDLVTTSDMTAAITYATSDKITAEQAGTQISTALTSYSTTEEMNTAINSAVSSVYRYAGSVATYANLPTENVSNGDVYNVTDTDMNYAWVQPDTGTGYWDPLGSTFSIEPIPNSVIQEIVDGTYGTEVV